MIKKIFSNVSNKVKAVYLLWILVNLFLLLVNAKEITHYEFAKKNNYNLNENKEYLKKLIELRNNTVRSGNSEISHTKIFFPFTSLEPLNLNYIAFYDITEFIFYTLFPIFIYVIIKLFTTKEKLNE